MDTTIVVSKSAVWFIPGQLGAEEIINKFVLYLIGISSLNFWLSVSILRRVRLLFWSSVAGVFYAGLTKKNSGNTVSASKKSPMDERKIAKLELKTMFAERYPKWKLPGFVFRMLEKIIAVDKINKLFAAAPGKKNMEFIDACMDYLRVTCNVEGAENLPFDGSKLIFASNHPQGGIEAICIASVLGRKYDGKVKFYVNEILCSLEPLNEMFLPLYRRRQQSKENARIINDFYKTDNHLVVFPAGITASKMKGKLMDHEWRKNFITAAIQNQRDVVPLYFQAQNSKLFYFIEDFRRFIRCPVSFEIILFGHEFFRQKGKTFNLFIGKPVAWQTFDKTKSLKEWANVIKGIALGLPDRSG